jgi:hypothetical protein
VRWRLNYDGEKAEMLLLSTGSGWLIGWLQDGRAYLLPADRSADHGCEVKKHGSGEETGEKIHRFIQQPFPDCRGAFFAVFEIGGYLRASCKVVWRCFLGLSKHFVF